MERKLPQIVDVLKRIYADLQLDAALDTEDIISQWKAEKV